MARQRDWQERFENFKELSIKLFFNEPFSPSQEIFLYWLKVYDHVFEEKSGRDFDILTDKVINNYIFTDAYFAFAAERHRQDLYKNRDKDKLATMEKDLKQPLQGMNAMTIEYE